jgi:hypothetical protein
MISSRTTIPVDDARLATGENSERARIMLAFSTMEVVSIAENGGLVSHSSYHWREKDGRGMEGVCIIIVREEEDFER